MTKAKVLISGASVAGPALAFFLNRDGYEVSVVERAPEPRDSGYAVDFRGEAFDVLEELGVLAEMRGHDTKMRGTTLLDDKGVETGRLPAEAFAGELEVPKQELTRALHRITADDVTYVFDDSISALTQHGSGIAVEFERGAAREFDLVIGADGVYSKVRQLAFGPHTGTLRHLGLSGVGFSTPDHLGLERSGLLQQGPGAALYLFGSGAPNRLTVSFSFATVSPALDRRSRDEQENAVRTAFSGFGGEAPRLLEAMSEADDFYFSSACQIHLDHWSRGRIALVGDAGYCAAPTSGMGTSQALIGARSLARNLASAAGDHMAAFAAYEEELRPYVTRNQAAGRQAATMFGGHADLAGS
ncbi:FAD-dependent monooxygenase [Streptosporangium sandarakinum]|uniref:2-polyprenyl-6-methoxyphenol hydroxylase-like FAD-dependent oxidoreductase n=1 Tax=Streptosporangium sandarakinum TaxID=1260955 RepID=A0A852V334_9ACTN|nr:FAD-dependent monooxygenase [Streptosporangium sandarakinum]NYF41634.1 2-polyprenyl-6-methoxyphenol hydroxylase-like FAD-dependent oxidoreductase [Streptosporangium sandarakinum]